VRPRHWRLPRSSLGPISSASLARQENNAVEARPVQSAAAPPAPLYTSLYVQVLIAIAISTCT
jgi:hypothetical protein